MWTFQTHSSKTDVCLRIWAFCKRGCDKGVGLLVIEKLCFEGPCQFFGCTFRCFGCLCSFGPYLTPSTSWKNGNVCPPPSHQLEIFLRTPMFVCVFVLHLLLPSLSPLFLFHFLCLFLSISLQSVLSFNQA